MKYESPCCSRRQMLKAAMAGGAASLLSAHWAPRLARAAQAAAVGAPAAPPARLALTAGEDHADIIFQSLAHLKDDIARAIGDKPVIIKPNNVSIEHQLSATPVESIEGILEFLKSIGKLDNVMIAESAANGPTFEGYSNYGYNAVAQKYNAKLVDLDQAEVDIVHALDQFDMRPHPVRVAKMMLDRRLFVISAGRIKTHDRVVATLSLKNIVVGAPIKDAGFRWGSRSRQGAVNDKPIIHGNGFHGLQYNLYALAPVLRPDLAVIDGYQGMEGNGPVGGTPVEHRVAVTSLDWVAADRVAVELMGIPIERMGYLNYCANAGMGQIDLNKIEVLGARIADHVRTYKLAKNVDAQLEWMNPLRG